MRANVALSSGLVAGLLSLVAGCSGGDAAADAGTAPPETVAECFEDISSAVDGADYDRFMPKIDPTCAGTANQQIEGVERVVFLGDSVTAGTPPTPVEQYYRSIVTAELQRRFPGVEVEDCSKYGARTDDLLEGGMQIPLCFPDAVDDRVTLTIFTMGGNDFSSWAGDMLPADEAIVEAEKAADLLQDAIAYLTDPAHFPNGSFVVYANPYEYTDGTGDLQSCALASVAIGSAENYLQGKDAVLLMQQRFMEIAVDYGVDMVFAFEHFCGHGYHHDDPEAPCYRGPDAELWFDLTCSHPNPTGHAALADLFLDVIGRAPESGSDVVE